MENEYNLPTDWESPEWQNCDRAHGWRNYASKDVEKEWPNFTEYQKKILAIAFNESASREQWD